jgi:hypothetical protein
MKALSVGLAWTGEVQSDTPLVGPEVQIPRNELSPSVDSDCLRECELPANLFEDLDMNEVHRPGLEHAQLPASRKLIIRLRG